MDFTNLDFAWTLFDIDEVGVYGDAVLTEFAHDNIFNRNEAFDEAKNASAPQPWSPWPDDTGTECVFHPIEYDERGELDVSQTSPGKTRGPGQCLETSGTVTLRRISSNTLAYTRLGRSQKTASAKEKHASCPECGLQMLRRTLPRHLRSIHLQTKPNYRLLESLHYCFQCQKTFARKDNLERHMHEIHGDKTGTVECNVCGANIRERALQYHWKSKKCKQAQDELMLARSSAPSEISIASLSRPGRFSAPTVTDPLFVALQFWFTFGHCDFYEQIPSTRRPEYLHVRSILLRTMIGALDHPTKSEARNAAAAMWFMSEVTYYDIRFDTERTVLLNAIIALEARFEDSLSTADLIWHLARPAHKSLSCEKDICGYIRRSIEEEWPYLHAALTKL